MPTVITYDARGNKVVLGATGRKGMYEKLDKDGNYTGSQVNLKTALQCGSLFTEEQHLRYLANKAKNKVKAARK
jgi:hypothetical protein